MRLATFQDAGQVRIGALNGRWMIDLKRARQYLAHGPLHQGFPSDMMGLLRAGDRLLAELSGLFHQIAVQLPKNEPDLLAVGIVLPMDEIQYLPPVQAPGKILCVGLNYPMPGIPADRPAYPVIFGKFANTLVGHRQTVILPRVSEQVACEGELALVISKAGRHIPLEKSLDHLAGVTLANDLTASDLENRSSQWMTGKLPDTFTPLGPALVTLDEIPALDELVLRTYRNGELVLSGHTGTMLHNARELISYLSGITTLEVGDLILTGSPKGIGNQPVPRVFISPGDEIAVEIESIGRLVNHAVAEESDDR
jgi:2-keto-4-pentenoate hydratase/2-oxohepta-3-ene-1,7-dioic acid hydratase in catechol pathway